MPGEVEGNLSEVEPMKLTTWTWSRKAALEVPDPAADSGNVSDVQSEHQLENAELLNQVRELQADIATKEIEIFHLKSIQRSSLDRYQSMFYELPLPCFTLNEIGHIMEWNHAAAAYFNLPEYEVIDKPASEILGSGIFRSEAEGTVYKVFLGQHPDPVNIKVDLPNGISRNVRWFVSPVRNSRGDVVGAVNSIAIVPSKSRLETEIGMEEQSVA